MNSVLLMLNAMTLVILIGFQFHSQTTDPALVHVDAARFIPEPVARVASASTEAPLTTAKGVSEPATTQRTERYTF